MDIETLKYPIGKFEKPSTFSEADVKKQIEEISTFPQRLRTAIENLSEERLDTPYRPGGWTVRQVVHHCADSHMNALIRFKLTLTEDKPVVKTFEENEWAKLPDTVDMPVAPSLQIIEGVHARWTHLLKGFSEEQFKKTFIHPAGNVEIPLYVLTALYAWHGNHHLAHITSLPER